MSKLYYVLFFFITLELTAQDSLAKYTPKELGYKSSMATRLKDKPLLWKIYLDAMIRKNPTDSLRTDTYYNLAIDTYRYTDYNIEFSTKLMKQAIYYAKRSHNNELLLYCFDGLGSFYAIKNDNIRAFQCIKEIKKLHNHESLDDIAYLKFNESRIYWQIGDFERAISILSHANKNIETYVSEHPALSKEIKTGLIYDRKLNYIKLAGCYNFQKKLDSSAYCIKKIREIEKQGYLWHNNFDWIEEAFYLVLSKKYDHAIAYIAESEKKGFIDSKDKKCRADYYLAMCWEQKKDYAKSLKLCEKALDIHIRIPSFINYELELYRLAASNASKLGETNKESYYSRKYNEASQQLDYMGKSKFLANLYEQDVIEAKGELKSEKIRSGYLYFIFIILLVLFCYLIIHYLKLKKDRKKFKAIIVAFENNELENILHEANKDLDDSLTIQIPNIDRKTITLSFEVDEKIMKQLSKFETKERFLSPNISLSNMASDFNTNSAYLSAVIKKHKNTNFNGYINDNRLEYIIKKLKTSPEYLNYKIAYLAEECGFSSHTVFIRIFTQKTGLTPSKFINFLKTEKIDLQIT
ncbi:AraC family transcriptional regulator [Chryseobacterium ginsenosidimutans]|uniref:helix-turn-helix transcriptional regulator n=1 Tax=Chryseobacterium ginsenosidimutans TaxID=687846 RepID=UPI0031CDD454